MTKTQMITYHIDMFEKIWRDYVMGEQISNIQKKYNLTRWMTEEILKLFENIQQKTENKKNKKHWSQITYEDLKEEMPEFITEYEAKRQLGEKMSYNSLIKYL